jgi:hypothetical protein
MTLFYLIMCKYKRAFLVGLLQITGCMIVVNPSALPYKRVCGNCKLGISIVNNPVITIATFASWMLLALN